MTIWKKLIWHWYWELVFIFIFILWLVDTYQLNIGYNGREYGIHRSCLILKVTYTIRWRWIGKFIPVFSPLKTATQNLLSHNWWNIMVSLHLCSTHPQLLFMVFSCYNYDIFYYFTTIRFLYGVLFWCNWDFIWLEP